jgi:LuxR family maltose regulon positive regulatory protein
LGTLAAITNLARLKVMQGRLHAATATYREMTQIAIGTDQPVLKKGDHMLEGPAYYAGMGDLLREWNDFDTAEQQLAQVMDQLGGRLVVDAEDVALGYLALARLQHARGEYATAQRTLATYIDLARQRDFVPHLIARGTAVQAQLALAQGDVAAAVAWADASNLHVADELHFPREAEYLILARIWIAQADNQSDRALCQQAFDLLARLLADATAKGRLGSVLEILIVRALGQWTQGGRSDALATLTQALTLAAPEGYIRRFVDEGEAMRLMILDFRFWHPEGTRQQPPTKQNRKLSVYADELLAAFGHEQANAGESLIAEQSKIQNPKSKIQNLVEPLSQRELEVLRLIAVGKSNAEIAQALVIALSTVKTHTNSIFGKLQATSRTQALARAQALQLF